MMIFHETTLLVLTMLMLLGDASIERYRVVAVVVQPGVDFGDRTWMAMTHKLMLKSC